MFERNGNDVSVVATQVTGHVIYVKHDYGFIRPDNKSFDDVFFHVRDVEPWREGFKHLVGRKEEKRLQKDDGTTVVVPHFPGEQVVFDIKESGKMVTDRFGATKKGYKAVNIELITEYKSEVIEGKEKKPSWDKY